MFFQLFHLRNVRYNIYIFLPLWIEGIIIITIIIFWIQTQKEKHNCDINKLHKPCETINFLQKEDTVFFRNEHVCKYGVESFIPINL